MTKALFLPDHLIKKREEEKKIKEEKEETAKLPQPVGWRILIMPYNPPKKTAGGVELPDEVHERERLATVVGLVMAVGPLAYKDPEKFGNPSDPTENWEPWCKEKDWVLFGMYAGSRFKIDGGELRLLNDDEILAVIDDPSFINHT